MLFSSERALGILLASSVLVALPIGCERKQEQPSDSDVEWSSPFPWRGYERVSPEKVPANIDARLLRPWKEDAQFDAAGSPAAPIHPISRFWFSVDGGFCVNWRPFEPDYWEYWGKYSVNKATGELILKMTGGCDMPADFVGRGTYSFDSDGRLILSGIWLGTPPGDPAATRPAIPHHGHRFRDSGHYASPKQEGH